MRCFSGRTHASDGWEAGETKMVVTPLLVGMLTVLGGLAFWLCVQEATPLTPIRREERAGMRGRRRDSKGD